MDDAVVWTVNKGQETYTGKDQVREYFNGWKSSFPDLKIRITNKIPGEDQIAVEYEFVGTHKGVLKAPGKSLPDIQPTDKRVSLNGSYIARIKNNRIVSVNNYPDRIGLLSQLGVFSSMFEEVA